MKQESFNTEAEILYNSHYVAIPYGFADFDSFAVNGVIPAGTLIYTEGDDESKNYIGFALHDVYLNENANGALVVHGFINQSRVPDSTFELIDSDFAAIQAQLPQIYFLVV